MRRSQNRRKLRYAVVQALAHTGISKEMRDTKLSNERFQQMSTAFYLHRCWSSPGILKYRAMSLWRLVGRMDKHAEHYERGNDQVRTGFAFIKKMVEGWYPKSLFGE